jgi:hypothetical protein
MVARNLMNHNTIASDIAPAKRQVTSIFRRSALRPKQQQSPGIHGGDIFLANGGEYDDVTAHPFRDRKIDDSTNLSTDFPNKIIGSAAYELPSVRRDVTEPALDQISPVLPQPVYHVGSPKLHQFRAWKISVMRPVSSIKKRNEPDALSSFSQLPSDFECDKSAKGQAA